MTKSDVIDLMNNKLSTVRGRPTKSASFKCLYNYDIRYFYLIKRFY
ncbi:hypothetical protein JDW21_16050 [Bacillus subtilis]|nr:hypothetical protein D9C10_17375 [Bacillus subtilis subsp. subtilis]MBC9026721.1 hypothetical protein [Bacillus subtilis]UNU14827.1 hypothetical protein JOW61_19190 [Bacillus subtilis subsp. natto]UQC68466.1 hypothetical protein ZHX2020_08205 [Bacillus sp. ZHX3]AYK68480.1 hypothetical protein D9C09_00920 [Bacillus subtilis subsp. subtilis]